MYNIFTDEPIKHTKDARHSTLLTANTQAMHCNVPAFRHSLYVGSRTQRHNLPNTLRLIDSFRYVSLLFSGAYFRAYFTEVTLWRKRQFIFLANSFVKVMEPMIQNWSLFAVDQLCHLKRFKKVMAILVKPAPVFSCILLFFIVSDRTEGQNWSTENGLQFWIIDSVNFTEIIAKNWIVIFVVMPLQLWNGPRTYAILSVWLEQTKQFTQAMISFAGSSRANTHRQKYVDSNAIVFVIVPTWWAMDMMMLIYLCMSRGSSCCFGGLCVL